MKISLDEVKEAQAPSGPDLAPDQIVDAIVKVKHAEYVPSGVRLRARMDPYLFTASFTAGDLSRIQSDPDVLSVEISKPLHMIK